jgi:membrane protein
MSGYRQMIVARDGKSRVGNIARLILCAGRYWSSDNASTTGAALAFFCAFSLAPLLVILLTIAGMVIGEQAAYGDVQAQLQALFGPSTAKTIMGAVQASQHTNGAISTIVSIVTLIVGASTVLTALQSALDQIWQSSNIAPRGLRGFIRSRLLSFGFILTLGFLLLVSLTISTALSNVRAQVARQYAGIVGMVGAADFLASLIIIACLFALIYRYMPARRVRWRTVIAGGILTAVLFDVGRWGIGLYLAHSTEPSAFGAAASFAALLLWLYYTAQIFLFGAEFTACLAGGREENTQDRPRLGRLQPVQANTSNITSQIGAQTDGKAQADLETAT